MLIQTEIATRRAPSLNIEEIQNALEEFAKKRDWNQFHSPKNLAMALSVEAAELLEHFQWLSEADSSSLDPVAKAAVSSEIADVQIYLLRLADKLGINIEKSVEAKLKENDRKYPAEVVKGSAAKYTEYK